MCLKNYSFMKHLLYILSFVFCLPIMAESQTTRINKNLDIYTDVMRQLDINYVDTLNYDQLISTSINAMLNQVDPYTIYMPKSEDDQLRMMTTGKYGGIGAVIMQRDSNVYISDPYEHMPAAEAGLMAGDKLCLAGEMGYYLSSTIKENPTGAAELIISPKYRGIYLAGSYKRTVRLVSEK
jgi:carboxyl-terminal processing protease